MARFSRKRKSFRGRKPYGRKSRKLVGRVKRVERRVNKLSSTVETKYIDVVLNANATSTGTTQLLTGLSQGQTESTRIGIQSLIKSITFAYTFLVSDVTNFCRLIVFKDKNPQGSKMSSAQVLNHITAGTYLRPFSPYNWTNRHKVKILYDSLHLVNNSSTGQGNTLSYKFYQTIKVNSVQHHITTGNDDASIGSNGIYVLALSDSTAGNGPVVNGIFRVKYQDA